MTHKHTISVFAVLLLALVAAAPVFAGGPLVVCQSGVPFLWPNGGQNVEYNVDQGGLGPLSNAQGKMVVANSFQTWADIPSSTLSFVEGPMLSDDIDITNFLPIFNPVAPNGLSEIVFDETGEIFDLLFGPFSGVLGFAGPDFGNTLTCELLEGSAFLNGPEFTDLVAATDITVHEFGHFSNFAHSVVNGQIFIGDTSGPTPGSFGIPPMTEIETMYPFYFGTGAGTQTLERDDIAIASTMYPEPDFFATTGTIAGTIFAPDGTTRLTGVNVIARNLADLFNDAASAISSDFTDSTSQADPVVGTYRINGLTPGADYVVFVDGILAGGFSTPPLVSLPGPEEFWNGANESSDPTIDDPLEFTPITVAAGAPVTGIDVIFNGLAPGTIELGDDDFVEIDLGFTFTLCDQSFETVFVNSNGNLTFGAPDTDFSESAAELLANPPRIAGLWDDLNPSSSGTVSFDRDSNRFSVTFTNVPEFFSTGANTFTMELKRAANEVDIVYGGITASDGIAGVSCGGLNSGQEPEIALNTVPLLHVVNMQGVTAAYEQFTTDNDLSGYHLRFVNLDKPFVDPFEPNNNVGDATAQSLPFDTAGDFTVIAPVGDDVDYFRVSAEGGTSLLCEVTSGGFDSVLGIFDADTGDLLDFDDDGGAGLLSRLVFPVPADGDFAIAVSAFPDLDFNGDGNSGGRYVLSCLSIEGVLLPLGDDDTENVAIGFSFPYQGNSYNSVNVNSNGNLTFGGGDTDFSESESEFLNELPRIAPLWDDLNPSSAGLVLVNSDATSWTVTFLGVPEFASTNPNTFAVTLESDGTITIEYGVVSANDGLVGITQGGGAPVGQTDLSAGGPFSATGTTYEVFPTFDLDGATLLFLP